MIPEKTSATQAPFGKSESPDKIVAFVPALLMLDHLDAVGFKLSGPCI